MADIRLDSRYSTATLKRDENGVEYVDWFGDIKFDVSKFDDNIEHVVQPEDTVFNIASRYLGSQRYYWAICRSNVIFNPFKKLIPGRKMIIPSIKTFRTKILGE